MKSLQLHCPSKVNLALSVGAPRSDGMHPIASWMVAVDFGDQLTLSPRESASKFDIVFVDGRGIVDWPLEKDLAFRAHGLLEAAAGRPLPIDLKLRKRTPAGAGLGGGSSNAAATLVGVNDLYKLGHDVESLVIMGLRLGSDVGFLVRAMRGQTAALVTGIGEAIEPLPARETIDLVLIFPGFGSPTGPVYKQFDRMQPSSPPDRQRVRALAVLHPLPPSAPFNDLADPACAVVPGLGDLRRRLAATLRMPVHVTGSGSTLFVVARDAAHAADLATAVGPSAVSTRTLAPRNA